MSHGQKWTPERIAEIAEILDGTMWYGRRKPEPYHDGRRSSDPGWKIPKGTRVRIATVELPEMRQVWLATDGTLLHADRTRRANRARTCWQLQYLDGRPLYVGLFVGPDQAREYARAHRWHLEELADAYDRDPDAGHTHSGGTR